MTITLEETKKYLRIGHNVDDTYITELIAMSKNFIKQCTGVEYNNNDDVYKMAILQCVAHFYDKRETVSEKAVAVVPFTLDGLIKHIGMRGELE